MNITIKANTIDLTPALKDYAEKRLGGIAKFTDGDADIALDIGKETTHHKQGEVFAASVTVTTPLGRTYHATSTKADLYEAIDDVRNDVLQEIKSTRGKHETLFKRGARRVKNMLRGFR